MRRKALSASVKPIPAAVSHTNPSIAADLAQGRGERMQPTPLRINRMPLETNSRQAGNESQSYGFIFRGGALPSSMAECRTLAREYQKFDTRALSVTRLPAVVSYRCVSGE